MINIQPVTYFKMDPTWWVVCLFLLYNPCCGYKNVLMLISDDLRPQLNSYSGPDFPSSVSPRMYTPNIDGLANKSIVFKRAYCQYALCNPSRTSFLTSRRPDTTKVTSNSVSFKNLANYKIYRYTVEWTNWTNLNS